VSDPQTVRFRLPTRRLLVEALALPAMWFVGQVVIHTLDPTYGPGLVPLTVLVGVASIVMLALTRRQGVELTPYYLVVRGRLFARWIPWDEVFGITVRRMWGESRVAFATATHGEVSARGPLPAGFDRDPEFDEKVEQIGRHWVEHRGASWVPQPRYYPDGVWRADRPSPPPPPPPYAAT
jgi:hypothetical protein